MKSYVGAGKLGCKSGEGFYSDYNERCTLYQTIDMTLYRMGDASP